MSTEVLAAHRTPGWTQHECDDGLLDCWTFVWRIDRSTDVCVCVCVCVHEYVYACAEKLTLRQAVHHQASLVPQARPGGGWVATEHRFGPLDC